MIELRPTVLRLGNVPALAQALPGCGIGNADAVDVPRRNADGAGKSDEERVQVGTFAAEISGFEHEADIAGPATDNLRVAVRTFDDPVEDGARPSQRISAGVGCDLARGVAHDAIERNVRCRLQVQIELFARNVIAFARPRQIHAPIACRDEDSNLQFGCRRAIVPLREEGWGAIFWIAIDAGLRRDAGPADIARALILGVAILRQRQPELRRDIPRPDLDVGDHFERAPWRLGRGSRELRTGR